jgi:predicted DNA-binding helix-hairpin-helix protein
MSTEIKPITESKLENMKVHEVLEHHKPPYFRVMRVYDGWLYNFYDESVDDYRKDWIYVSAKTK